MHLALLWMLLFGFFDVPIEGSASLAQLEPAVGARPNFGSGALHTMEDGTTQPPPR